MAQYHVYFRPNGEYSVRIEVPDNEIPEFEDELVDRLIDEAHDALPGDVCAQCSGWGQKWSFDMSDPEVVLVEKDDGTELFKEK